MNLQKLLGGTVASAVMLSSSVLLTQSNSFADVSSVESEVQTSSYWYPDEMEIAKQEICKQFNEDYTAITDLLERYSTYCKINNSEEAEISQLWLEENGDSYSQFAYTTESNDSAEIHLYYDPDKTPDIQELYTLVDSNDVAEITQEKYERMEYIMQGGSLKPVPTGEYYNAVKLNFASYEHEKNAALTMKIHDKLKEDFKISHFHIDFNNGTASYNKRIDWTKLYLIDDFGVEIPLSEELTEKQVATLNEKIKEKGFDVYCDSETYTLNFNEKMDVYEHFDFAEYLYDTYGFYSKTAIPYKHIEDFYGSHDIIDSDSPYYPKNKSFSSSKEAQYSDMPGDLNGDGDTYYQDLEQMSDWLLGANPENSDYVTMPNPQNADLNNDGRLDVYDMILLREIAAETL